MESKLFSKGEILWGPDGDWIQFSKNIYLGDKMEVEQVIVNGKEPEHNEIVPDWIMDIVFKRIKEREDG